MENTINRQQNRGFFQILAEIAFLFYLVTLYIFVDREESVIISNIAFILYAGLAMVVIFIRQRVHLGKDVMIVYLTMTWMLASYFWASNNYVAWTSIKTMWKLFLMFFLTYNLFSEKEDAYEFLLKGLYLAGIVLIGYSIYTYGLGGTIEMLSGNRNIRLGRDINQENTFGMMNATTCMTAFYYLFYKKKFKLFHIAAFASAFLFAMSSGSRKALLMVLIGVLFLVYKKYGIRRVYKIVLIVAVLAFIFVNVMKLPVFDTINYRMEQAVKNFTGEKGDNSSAVRASMITEGLELFKERILVGYGINNFSIVSRFRGYAHNNFVEILVDLGLIGFLLYYFIYWTALKNLWKVKSDAGKALLCVFVVRFIMEMAAVTYYSKLHWILFAFFLLKSNEESKNTEGDNENENLPEKIEKGYI